MSEHGGTGHEPSVPLPHQAAFIERFFAAPTVRVHLLQSDAGLGKSLTVAHLIRRLLEVHPNARILVLLPKALLMQMRSVLSSIGVNANVVDRFRYRELQDAVRPDDTVWRAGGVFLLSVDFARQEDIADNLATVAWTLLVVPEAHLLRGRREQVVRRIVASSPDLQMVLATVTGIDEISTFGIEPVAVTRWNRSQVVDHAGRRLCEQPPTHLQFIEFEEETPERQIRETVEEIVDQLGGETRSIFQGSIIRESLASSPAALEGCLCRLRNRLAHDFWEPVDDVEDEDENDALDLPGIASERPSCLLAAVNNCLAELESLTVDSKLNAFVGWLTTMQRKDLGLTRICVVTEYLATLFYLQTRLNETGLEPLVVSGAMSFDDRARNVDTFRRDGGILLATSSTMEGFDLPQVETLILYDLPRSTLRLTQLYGRFQRFGRKTPLRLAVLRCPTRADSTTVIFDKLLELVTDQAQ